VTNPYFTQARVKHGFGQIVQIRILATKILSGNSVRIVKNAPKSGNCYKNGLGREFGELQLQNSKNCIIPLHYHLQQQKYLGDRQCIYAMVSRISLLRNYTVFSTTFFGHT
jgi:hypothetical protein